MSSDPTLVRDGGRRAPSVSRGETIVPVVQEELTIDRRAVDTGSVVIRSTVVDQPVERRETLVREVVEVDRVPGGGLLEAPPEVRVEGEVTIVPVVEEVLVRRWRLVEEVRVVRHRREEEQLIRETLRSNRVKVIPQPGSTPPSP